MNRILSIIIVLLMEQLSAQEQTTFEYRDSVNRAALDLIDSENWVDAEAALNSAELISLQAKDSVNLSFAYHNNGVLNYYQNNYSVAKDYFKKAYDIRVQIKDSLGQARSISNVGVVSIDQGEYTEAIGYYFKALRMYEQLHDSTGISISYTNIGNVYYYEGDQAKALEQYLNSLRIDKAQNDEYAMAEDYQNIGLVISGTAVKKMDKELFDSTMTLYEKAIELYSKGENSIEIADVNLERGTLCEDFGFHEQAESYFQQALETHTRLENKFGLAETYLNIGGVFYRDKEYEKAKVSYEKAKVICEEIGMLEMLKECYQSLSEVHRALGEEEEAYTTLINYIAIKDSLISVHNKTVLAEMDAKYQTEKKQHMIDKLEQDHAIQEAESERRGILLWALSGILILSLVFAYLIYGSMKKQRAAKELIELQRIEVELQKSLVEEKNREVTDSITYAKRIQTALLNSEVQLSQFLSNYFVLFKPQSIVSGDFYWAEKIGKKQLFTVADCTGHGVPGGFMSMIGIIMLNEIFNSKKIYTPAQVLKELNRILILSLQRYSDTAVKDGMDMAFCSIEPHENEKGSVAKLTYAGANNPLYLVRTSYENFVVNFKEHEPAMISYEKKLLEIKADKYAIGYDLESSSFVNHEIELYKGDVVYLFSDGFADQFGGERGRKYMYKRFKELLLEHSSLPMDEQKKKLSAEFETWKGKLDQIDDVCILGVRV